MRTAKPSESPARQLAGFLAKYSTSMAKEGRASIARMRTLVPGAVELVYDNWNGLVIGYGPTERASDGVLSLLMARAHISLCFIDDGPSLPDPERLLKGTGNVVRHIRLTAATDLDSPPVRALIRAAVDRSDPRIDSRRPRRTVIKSVSKRQRPRRAI